MGGDGATCPATGGRRREYAVMHASNDQSGVARRRFLKGTLATAAGGLLVPAVASRSQAAAALPVVGQTVNLSVSVFGAVMTSSLQSGEQTLNFIGSRVVKALAGGPDFVRLQSLDFTLEAAHPLFGKITMTLPDVDVSPLSTVRLSSSGFTETWYETSKIKFERSGNLPGPFEFQSEKPPRLPRPCPTGRRPRLQTQTARPQAASSTRLCSHRLSQAATSGLTSRRSRPTSASCWRRNPVSPPQLRRTKRLPDCADQGLGD